MIQRATLAIFSCTYMFLFHQNLSITFASFKTFFIYLLESVKIYGICKQPLLTITTDKIAVMYHCLCISIFQFALMLLALFISKAYCLILFIELLQTIEGCRTSDSLKFTYSIVQLLSSFSKLLGENTIITNFRFQFSKYLLNIWHLKGFTKVSLLRCHCLFIFYH